jgi:citrate synthase
MANGLDDVIAAETVLSDVDGENGTLIMRGHHIEELAGTLRFEDAVGLLWQDIVPSENDIAGEIGEGRAAAFERFAPLAHRLGGLSPIDTMRSLVATIGDETDLAKPARLVGAFGVAAAIGMRAARGEALVVPSLDAGHAADMLRMIRGRPADATEARALDAYLVTVMDHGLNASTFAARVVASTHAGLVSSLVAALSALKGPLHGGAPGPVLDMLDAIGTAENAEVWMSAALERGERLMGFGHRIYRVRDPRADVLRAALRALRGRDNRIALADAVEKAGLALLARRKPGRRLDVNVEFATALLLEALGVSRQGFTALFAAGRVAGWTAHVFEQTATGRIMRPRSRYVGPTPVQAA